ncbi:MAG: c-type cytochrome [Anaerolineales bacterium]|nr:c-type cytochrome [Anaerolineales bacterium]
MMRVRRKLWWMWGITAVFLPLLFFTFTTTAQEADPTPTIDRLAAPPTVPSPTLADEGAQLFWLNCQPCHGDQGQGLTDEWRAQYPMEDQYCWNSGCHGKIPYEEGFTLPTTVPAVIGDGALAKFETLAQLHQYIRVRMPFEYPGVLPEEEYLAITAFLARAHGIEVSASDTFEKLGELRLRPAATPAATAVFTPQPAASPPTNPSDFTMLTVGFVLIIMSIGGIWLWQQRQS